MKRLAPHLSAGLLVGVASAQFCEPGKIVPSDVGGAKRFGTSIAIAGDLAVVGAPGAEPEGAVYLFQQTPNGWTELARVDEPTAFPSDPNFGAAVDADGDFAIIGAPKENVVGTDSGAAWILPFSGSPMKGLAPSFHFEKDAFGEAVAIQAWYRDPNGHCGETSNTTNALKITFTP